MKKSLFLSLVLFVISQNAALAVTKTPTPTPTTKTTTPTESEAIEKIQRIKDIVASKVAELNLVEKRGIIGMVTQTSSTQITVKDMHNKTRIIDIDELTKFDSDEKDKELGISDLKKNTRYSFVGIYNKDTKRLLARMVSETSTIPVNIEGVVSRTDEDEFQIDIITEDGNKKTVDIEKSTKTNTYDEDNELVKSGFSEINVNDRIIIIGFTDAKDENLISASRVIHFKKIPPSQKMQSFINLNDENTISSGSGKKLETKSLKAQ